MKSVALGWALLPTSTGFRWRTPTKSISNTSTCSRDCDWKISWKSKKFARCGLLSVARMWCYCCYRIFACKCLWAVTVIVLQKFVGHLCKYSGVASASCATTFVMLIRPVKVLRIQSTNFKWIGFKSVRRVQIPGNGVNSVNIQNDQCASLGNTCVYVYWLL